MKTIFYVLLLIAAGMEFLHAKRGVKKDIVRTLKFGNCDNAHLKKPKLSYFENITIVNVGKGMNVFNGKFIHKRDVEEVYSLYQIFRCETSDGVDCELFGSHKHDDYCEMMARTGEYWSPLWGAFRPKVKCPLYRNVYDIKNATIDASKLLALAKYIPNINNYFWMTKSNLYTLKNREYFGCMMLLFQFAQVRA